MSLITETQITKTTYATVADSTADISTPEGKEYNSLPRVKESELDSILSESKSLFERVGFHAKDATSEGMTAAKAVKAGFSLAGKTLSPKKMAVVAVVAGAGYLADKVIAKDLEGSKKDAYDIASKVAGDLLTAATNADLLVMLAPGAAAAVFGPYFLAGLAVYAAVDAVYYYFDTQGDKSIFEDEKLRKMGEEAFNLVKNAEIGEVVEKAGVYAKNVKFIVDAVKQLSKMSTPSKAALALAEGMATATFASAAA